MNPIIPDDYRRERKLRGTQKSVAAQLGVHPVTLAKRECGLQAITREAWLALLSLAPAEPPKRSRKAP